MAQTWPALEQEPLGGWVLRASGGFTNRSNAVLTSGSPDRPLEGALDTATNWYAERGLPLKVVRTGPVGFDPRRGGDRVAEAVLRRGGRAHSAAHVMVGSTGTVLAECVDADTGSVSIAATLPQPWLTAHARSRTLVAGATERVLSGSPGQVFAWVSASGGSEQQEGHDDVWAIGRLGIADGWGGLAAVWVDPSRRRGGAGQQVTAALVRAGAQHGLDRLHLQVEVDNEAAIRLYLGIGFEMNHDYVYLTAPRP